MLWLLKKLPSQESPCVIRRLRHGGCYETISDFAHPCIYGRGLRRSNNAGQRQERGNRRHERNSVAGPHCADQQGEIKPECSGRAKEHGEHGEAIFYDSSTEWTKQGKPADQNEFKEGSFVIVLGHPDDKGVLHATRVDLRLPR